ncbi:MFS general substrate transporter [Setomelanomma holmii]|uniref:MFS general substrate transporter n=1 Tax=Setomelanomma holmii TaxID=210430 RepID=A0A9P4GWK1_9PLEO|nr:MFS general substrate transporter [Setomelanomma holmii]
MTCDAYYETHQPDRNAINRCAKREIEAGAARAFALLAVSTTIFGLVNLLIAGWTIKRLGVKRALIIQVFWPAVRLLIQTIGVTKGSRIGITIVQSSQFITIVGGPMGYVLCLNSFVADVVSHEARTGALGRLQGCMYVGSATGFLIGGIVGEAFGIIAPFKMTLALFLSCCVYVAITLPATAPPEPKDDADSQPALGIARFFGPLRIFTPQKWILRDGRTTTQFGALTLGVGVFLGILATGYIAVLLQQYATSEFNFGTKANGYLIFMYSSLRGLFLSLIFPRIIALGRKWLKARDAKTQPDSHEEEPLIQDVPISANEIEVTEPMESEEPANPAPVDEQETFAFDLFYARSSVLLDAILTSAAVFVTRGWQTYLVALVLPFAAGTGAASKGTILQMLPSSDRVDALSGITLVENIARLLTTAVFGLAYSALAEAGQSHLIFVCNGAVALLGFVALLFSRFPPEGSKRVKL